MQKLYILIGLIAVIFISCNPAKRLNEAVAERNKQAASQTLVKIPKSISTPANINYVYDYEDLYTPAEERKLDSLLRTFETSNLIAIKLVTLGADRVNANNFDQNNVQLLNEWDGVHGNATKTMVIAISRGLEKIAVNYGDFVKKFLSPAETSSITQEAISRIKSNGAFYMETVRGLESIMDTIRKNIVYNPTPVTPRR